MKDTFFSYSFGCRVNEAEKEEIDRQMVQAGFQRSPQNPSIYIINTCSVTHKAEREARQHIYQVKRRFPTCKIIITGCSATYWKKNSLNAGLPVDEVYDNLQKEYLVSLLQKKLLIPPHPTQNLLSQTAESKFLSSGRFLVKIQDGCQRFCSFCIVPYLRGLPKSRKISEIVEMIKNQKGIKEVILTAINTEAFGYDTGEKFINLLQKVIDKTNIERISFGSIHPWSINDDFFRFYKKKSSKSRLVDFFHIPLQSGSNKILGLMKRGYTREEIIDKLHSIHRLNKFAFIGTDVIVGFLDESSGDFEDTYHFLKESPISKFHIFRFSKRQNTAAYYLSKRLSEASDSIKKKRAQALSDLNLIKYNAFLEKHVGKIFSALFLGRITKGLQKVLLSNQIPAYIKTDEYYSSEIKNVKLTDYKNGGLFGKIV